jgi:hypothetical protein
MHDILEGSLFILRALILYNLTVFFLKESKQNSLLFVNGGVQKGIRALCADRSTLKEFWGAELKQERLEKISGEVLENIVNRHKVLIPNQTK